MEFPTKRATDESNDKSLKRRGVIIYTKKSINANILLDLIIMFLENTSGVILILLIMKIFLLVLPTIVEVAQRKTLMHCLIC